MKLKNLKVAELRKLAKVNEIKLTQTKKQEIIEEIMEQLEGKKYLITLEQKEIETGRFLYRIGALKDFGDVKKGDLGGWVETPANLSQKGDCWLYHNSVSYGEGVVQDNAKVYHRAKIIGEFGENAKAFHRSICRVEYCGGNTVLLRDAELIGAYCRVTGDSVYYETEHAAGNRKYRSDKKIEQKKFRITNNWKITKNGRKVYQIQALRDIGCFIKCGDLGGWIEHEFNLSHQGDCWLDSDTIVEDHSHVRGNGRVYNTIISRGSVVNTIESVVDSCSIQNSIVVLDGVDKFKNNKIKNSKTYAKINDSSIAASYLGTYVYVSNSTISSSEVYKKTEIISSTIKNSTISSKLNLDWKGGRYSESWGWLVINSSNILNGDIEENGTIEEVTTSTFLNYENIFKYSIQVFDKDVRINGITMFKSEWRNRYEHGQILYAWGEHDLMHWFRANEDMLSKIIPYFYENVKAKSASANDVFNEKKEHEHRMNALAEIVHGGE